MVPPRKPGELMQVKVWRAPEH